MYRDDVIKNLKKRCCDRCGSDKDLCVSTPDRCLQKSLMNNEVFDALNEVSSSGEWISVKERLPLSSDVDKTIDVRKTVEVLVAYDGRTVPMYYDRVLLRGKVVCRWRYTFDRLVNFPEMITHWMPMPKPPKEV